MSFRRLPIGQLYMKGEMLEITVKVTDDGKNEIYCELPDIVFGFKSCTIDYPNLVILQREGFDDEEMSYIIKFIRNNKTSINEIIETGVIYAYD